MWEYPALILGLLKRHILLGKIQEQGQSIGNFIKSNYSYNSYNSKNLGSLKTTCEVFILD
jgi:hypothetical protein